jgi:hypothetical protein
VPFLIELIPTLERHGKLSLAERPSLTTAVASTAPAFEKAASGPDAMDELTGLLPEGVSRAPS